MRILTALKRHRVHEAAVTYVVAALAVWGAVDVAVDAFGWSGRVMRFTIAATVAGLPLTLMVCWWSSARRTRDAASGHGVARAVVWQGMAAGAAGGLVTFALLLVLVPASASREEPPAIPGFSGRAAIAVLPFVNRSDDQANDYFADGIAEEVLVSLQGWGVFPVVSRNSAFVFRGDDVDIPTVAAALGVRYVLEGSVRRAADDVRITAQLVDGTTDTQVWASRYERTLDDVFAVQDEIAEAIVTAIAPELTRSEMRRVRRSPPADLTAWELMLRAQALILEGTLESVMEARELLGRVLDRDPDYALAYARLAEVGHDISNNLSREFGSEAAAALAEALEQARTSVRLDPSLVDARIWYGHLLLHHRAIDAGLRELREAVRMNPSHAQARAEFGFGLALAGNLDSAMSEFALVRRLSPNDPRNTRIRSFEALAYLYAGDYPKAARQARGVIDANRGAPSMIIPYVVEMSALVRTGRIDAAQASAAEFVSDLGELDWDAVARGAWSQEQLTRTYEDLVRIELIRE